MNSDFLHTVPPPPLSGGPWRGGVDNRKRRWNEGCGQPKAKDPAELMDTKYSLAGLMVKGTVGGRGNRGMTFID